MKKEVLINNSELQAKLNNLLSDYQLYYQNLRALHWLVKGPRFFQLHEVYEKYYDEAADVVDEIAERILMIGGKPLHTFQEYLNTSNIKPVEEISDESKGLQVVIDNSEHLLGSFREILDFAGKIDDEGTSALMSDLIGAAEKRLWMLKSMKA
ncbi:MAG: DNA starvation/stationary phase protection protein [Bacteroidales bacterium]